MTSPLTPDLRVVDGFDIEDISVKESLESGVTTAWITPGSGNVVGGIGSIVKTFGNTYKDWLVKEFAGLKMAFGENPKRVYNAMKKFYKYFIFVLFFPFILSKNKSQFKN